MVKKWIRKSIISDPLAKAWKLNNSERKKFDLRESQFCPNCKNSARDRALAEAIIKTFSYPDVHSLKDWVEFAKKEELRIAEINSCGNLHKILKKFRTFITVNIFQILYLKMF